MQEKEKGNTLLRVFEKAIGNRLLCLPNIIFNTYMCMCIHIHIESNEVMSLG